MNKRVTAIIFLAVGAALAVVTACTAVSNFRAAALDTSMHSELTVYGIILSLLSVMYLCLGVFLAIAYERKPLLATTSDCLNRHIPYQELLERHNELEQAALETAQEGGE